jgi:hypothetical protein
VKFQGNFLNLHITSNTSLSYCDIGDIKKLKIAYSKNWTFSSITIKKEKEWHFISSNWSDHVDGRYMELRPQEHPILSDKKAYKQVEKMKKEIRTNSPQKMVLLAENEINKNFLSIFKEVLGTGSYGTVYKGLYYQSPVAVKVLHEIQQSPSAKSYFRREAQFLWYYWLFSKNSYFFSSLRNPHIVYCFGYSMNDDRL